MLDRSDDQDTLGWQFLALVNMADMTLADMDDDFEPWAVDRFKWLVYANAAGARKLVASQGGCDLPSNELKVMRAVAQMKSLPVCKKHDEQLAVHFGAVFDHAFCGGHIWISLQSVYEQLKLKLNWGTGAAWFQKKLKKWRALAVKLGLHPAVCRQSQPYDSTGIGTDEDDVCKVLPFVSVHVSILFMEALAMGFAPNRRHGRCDEPHARYQFQKVFQGMLAYTDGWYRIPVRLDLDAVRLGFRIAGNLVIVLWKPIHLDILQHVQNHRQ